MRLGLVGAFAGAFLITAAPAHADPVVQTVEEHRNDIGEIERRGDQFVHRPSRYVFPAKLSEMPARKSYSYGPGDASLYYTLLGGAHGDPWLSLYVYPAKLPLENEAASIETSLVQHMPGRVIAAPAGVPALPPGVVEKWYDASVEGTALTTGYRLVRDGDWYIKVRLSIPQSGGQAARDRAWRALSEVRWSIPARVAPARTIDGHSAQGSH